MQSPVLIRIFLFFAFFGSALTSSLACEPRDVMRTGFDVKLYSYVLNAETGWRRDFFTSRYMSTVVGATTGITQSSFYQAARLYVVVTGSIYGIPTTVSNYTAELSGYFYARKTGSYTITMIVDDGAALQFGAGSTCCSDVKASVDGALSLNTIGTSPGVNEKTATFKLYAGFYYPVKVVMFNYGGPSELSLTYTDPDGNTDINMGDHIYQLDYPSCETVATPTAAFPATTTVTRTWGGSYVTTTTATGGLTNTVVVNVPTPTTTVTTIWTGSFTTSTTATGGPGQSNTVIVQIPKSTTTVTKTWGSSYATTTTGTGASTNTVVVNVPTPTTTVTTIWTGSYTITTTATGGPGESNTVIVQIPKSTTTITSTWGNSYATTTTGTGASTDTVVVAVPTPTVTITTYWTGEDTTSYTVTGGPGENNTIIVEIPRSITYFTRTYNGSLTATTTITGDGTKTVVVEVPTPTVTITSYWSGDFTTTTTVTGGPGENNTVVVEIPSFHSSFFETSMESSLSQSSAESSSIKPSLSVGVQISDDSSSSIDPTSLISPSLISPSLINPSLISPSLINPSSINPSSSFIPSTGNVISPSISQSASYVKPASSRPFVSGGWNSSYVPTLATPLSSIHDSPASTPINSASTSSYLIDSGSSKSLADSPSSEAQINSETSSTIEPLDNPMTSTSSSIELSKTSVTPNSPNLIQPSLSTHVSNYIEGGPLPHPQVASHQSPNPGGIQVNQASGELSPTTTIAEETTGPSSPKASGENEASGENGTPKASGKNEASGDNGTPNFSGDNVESGFKPSGQSPGQTSSQLFVTSIINSVQATEKSFQTSWDSTSSVLPAPSPLFMAEGKGNKQTIAFFMVFLHIFSLIF